MREILFRGKRIFDGKWVYGFAYKQYSAAKVEEWYIRAFETDYLVIPETVCQFTGITDKNGKKVFEGDIIDYNGELGKVVYCNDDAAFDVFFDTWNTDFSVLYARYIEVVGNIYDNPELLEVKQNG